MTFIFKLWTTSSKYEYRHGYTAATEEEIATFRLGPLVFGWEWFSNE